MNLPFNFRIGQESDAEIISNLVNAAYRGDSGRLGWTTESDLLDGQRLDSELYLDMIHTKESMVLVYGPTENPLACIYVQLSGDAAYLGMIAVSPLKQSQGTGSLVIETAEAYAKERWGVTKTKMTVITRRLELIEFYERRGYYKTGEVEPFPYGQAKFGLPKYEDLEFLVMVKKI